MSPIQHDWDLSPKEAVRLQQELREKIQLQPLQKSIRWIGGTDISFNLYSDIFYAAVLVLDIETMEVVERSLVKSQVSFPYIPGLLSFREIPTLVKAWNKLRQKPDAVMVDGHGIAHPRRLGIATHFGLVTGTPSLGCAKKILTGHYEAPAPEKGSYTPIAAAGQETLGYALRTKDRVKPVFISPGHLMSREDALAIAKSCMGRYKLPEPTRLAHLTVNQFRRGEISPKD